MLNKKWPLLLLAFLDYMGMVMVAAILPTILFDSTMLPPAWGEKARITLLGFYLALFPLGQFFGSAKLGRLSDTYGRRPILLATTLLTAIAFFISALSLLFSSVILLFTGRLLAGVFAANIAVAQAALSDMSSVSDKMRNMTSIQTAIGLGFIIGPGVGSASAKISFLGGPSYATPFYLTALFFGIAFLSIYFFFPETARPPTNAIKKESLFTELIEPYTNPLLRMPFIIWSAYACGWTLCGTFLPAYLTENFKTIDVGIFLTIMGFTYTFSQFFVVRKVASLVTAKAMVKIPLFVMALSYTALPFAKTSVGLHIGTSLNVIALSFVMPGLITAISNFESNENQGKIMGSISSIRALASIVVTIAGAYLARISLAAPLFGGGILLLISWILFVTKFPDPKKT